jgi:Xaa-Pro dipeptidase
MLANVLAIQRTLSIEKVDGWLLYDFHGSNPIARAMAGLANSTKMTTRRWFYFIPASGTPRKIVHAIEPDTLDQLPGERLLYANRQLLEQRLGDVLKGSKVIAMEFSQECSIPYLSRVDGGTIDLLRRMGLRIVSSGDLVQAFQAVWNDEEIATHREASRKLYKIKDQAFALADARLLAGEALTEYELQQRMVAWFKDEGLVTDAAPIVAAQEHAGNPHYEPRADRPRPVQRDEVLLLDLWGKLDTRGSVYADITWVGFTGARVPPDVSKAFAAIVAGRDAAVKFVKDAVSLQEDLHGWEVDKAARDVITAAGFGQAFIHRTGHSLGQEVHGNGVHMDDYETHDDRRLLPGTGFTIEPGIYTPEFGVRTEINMVIGKREATVTGPCQTDLVKIAVTH